MTFDGFPAILVGWFGTIKHQAGLIWRAEGRRVSMSEYLSKPFHRDN